MAHQNFVWDKGQVISMYLWSSPLEYAYECYNFFFSSWLNWGLEMLSELPTSVKK